MVLMGMGEHEPDQIAPLLHEKADVGHDEIDAGQVVAGKGDAEIDGEPRLFLLRAEAVERQVHADLADTAERRKDEFFFWRDHRRNGAPGPAAVKPGARPSRTGNTSPAVMVSRRPSPSRRISRPA